MDRLTFAITPTGNIEWHYPASAPDLTAAQAQVLATLNMADAVREVASALNNVADAIREGKEV